MKRSVAGILSEPGRDWKPQPPASEKDIAALRDFVKFDLPAEYIELLRFCNGGFGDLDAAPLLFLLNSTADSIEHNRLWRDEGEYQQFWFIGSNGGMETIGFDLREGSPFPLIMIDCIAGEDSAVRIAGSMTEFVSLIGIEHDPQAE